MAELLIRILLTRPLRHTLIERILQALEAGLEGVELAPARGMGQISRGMGMGMGMGVEGAVVRVRGARARGGSGGHGHGGGGHGGVMDWFWGVISATGRGMHIGVVIVHDQVWKRIDLGWVWEG